jgi:hypothetical protein
MPLLMFLCLLMFKGAIQDIVLDSCCILKQNPTKVSDSDCTVTTKSPSIAVTVTTSILKTVLLQKNNTLTERIYISPTPEIRYIISTLEPRIKTSSVTCTVPVTSLETKTVKIVRTKRMNRLVPVTVTQIKSATVSIPVTITSITTKYIRESIECPRIAPISHSFAFQIPVQITNIRKAHVSRILTVTFTEHLQPTQIHYSIINQQPISTVIKSCSRSESNCSRSTISDKECRPTYTKSNTLCSSKLSDRCSVSLLTVNNTVTFREVETRTQTRRHLVTVFH